MRTVRLAAVLLLALATMGIHPAAAHHADGPCDFHRGEDEDIRHFSARQIRCAVQRFGPVKGGRARAVCIARRESGLYPNVQSLTGMYLGLYQHAADDWDRRYEDYTKVAWDLPTSALRGRTNAVVAVRMAARAGGWREAGWPPKDC